jgi:S-DNA-T family DNA segregation ATPase FtsK/SpoIIIE
MRVRPAIVPYGPGYVRPQIMPDPPEQGPVLAQADGAAAAAQAPGTLFDIVISQLAGQGPPAHQIWLPPLDVPPTLDQLLPPLALSPEHGCTTRDGDQRGRLQAVTGVVDRPFDQRRDPLWADLSGAAGHVGVAGAPQSGKSTMIRALVCSLALLHTPAEVQFYLLDFGGGGMAALAGLPHVGGVASRLQAERVRRTVAEARALLERREREFAERGIESIAAYRQLRATGKIPGDGFGDLFLVVDGWLTLRQDYEQLEADITALAARGLGYGIHVVAATNKWSEFRPSIRDLFGTRFELRLGDPYESDMGRLLAANVPERSPGRGLTRDGMHFLTALPRIDGQSAPASLPDGLRRLVETVDAAWQGARAPAVRLLPAAFPPAQLPGPAQTGTRIPFGIDESTLSPVLLDFSADPHFLVLGDTECGKSNLLRVIAEAIVARYSPEQARLIVIDYRRSLLDVADTEHRIGYAASSPAASSLVNDAREALAKRLPPADLTAAQLRSRSWWSGSDLFLVVDDYDLAAGVTNPLLPLVDMLPQARDIGLHLILARSAGGAGRAMFEPVVQRLREMGSPALLMSASKDEGQLFGIKPQALPAGRGHLIARRAEPKLVQVALAETAAEPGPPVDGATQLATP